MPSDPLFTPYRLGALELPNRVLMAPMTRNRADAAGVPTDLAVEYYAQRASAGLIITEGTGPSALGTANPGGPGLYDDRQQDGWRRVADAVHDAGGRIFVQLMHAGRTAHPDTIGRAPVAPSALRADAPAFTPSGFQPQVQPRELSLEEIAQVQREYVAAAGRARRAGLDGVEVHATNGYLPHQFLAEGANRRTDRYGGSPANRAAFVVELLTQLAEAIGADRVGIKIGPAVPWNGIVETEEVPETYQALIDGIHRLGLAYLHVGEPAPGAAFQRVVPWARERWPGTLVATSGFANEVMTAATARRLLQDGRADLIAFGRSFLANPDLPARLASGAPLNPVDDTTLYTPGRDGYTTYPSLGSAGPERVGEVPAGRG